MPGRRQHAGRRLGRRRIGFGHGEQARMAAVPLTRIGPEDGGNFEYRWQGKSLEVHLLSDVGKARTQNEDSCILCVPEDETLARDYGHVFAVADGMGGARGGALASRLALETLVETYYRTEERAAPKRLGSAIRAANHRVFEEANNRPGFEGMGTTVSAAVVLGEYVYLAQVGDSRIYLARGRRTVHQLTQDHSFVAEQVRNGLITEDEARQHSLRNLITRAVGTRDTIKVDLFSARLQQDDTLLLCSDGLSNVVTDEEIAKSLTQDTLRGAARTLVGWALEAGGPDNITTVLVRVTEPLPKSRRDPGAVRIHPGRKGLLGRLFDFLR